MTDILETGSNWLLGKLRTHASREVSYQRGEEAIVVQATVGRTVFEQDDGAGVIVRTEVRDYLIDAVDLVLAGKRELPNRGDRIEETQNGERFGYEVMAIGTEPHWRYSDPYRKTLRIHTKLISTEPTEPA